MTPAGDRLARRVRAALLRGLAFLGMWVVLMGARADLPVGVVAAALAAWASVTLLPPGAGGFSGFGLARLAVRFVGQSIAAGWDVARRALDPRLPIKPGFVVYPVRFPPGTLRSAFTALTSLLPGTVPAGEQDGKIVYHCLDIDQPILRDLAAEEENLRQVLPGGRDRQA